MGLALVDAADPMQDARRARVRAESLARVSCRQRSPTTEPRRGAIPRVFHSHPLEETTLGQSLNISPWIISNRPCWIRTFSLAEVSGSVIDGDTSKS